MQRKPLLRALMSSVIVTLLLLALMPVMALGQQEEDRTCDDVGFPTGNKTTEESPRGDYNGEWGSIEISEDGKTIDLTLNEGYEFCVKAGNDPGVVTYTKSGTDEYTNAVSHFSWRTVDTTPEDTTTTVPEETTTTYEGTTTTTVEATTSSEASTTTSSSEATTTTVIAETSSTSETTDSTLPFTGENTGDWAAVAVSMLMVGGLALLVARTRHFDT